MKSEKERLQVAEEARIKQDMEREQRKAVESQRADVFASGWDAGVAAVIGSAREAAAIDPDMTPAQLIARLTVVFGK